MKLPEDRVGGSRADIELHRVTIRVAGRSLQYHDVQHAGVRRQGLQQAAGHLGRAGDPDMQHLEMVSR